MYQIKIIHKSVRVVIVTVVDNEQGDTSSNHGHDCICHCANTLVKEMNPVTHCLSLNKQWNRQGFSTLV